MKRRGQAEGSAGGDMSTRKTRSSAKGEQEAVVEGSRRRGGRSTAAAAAAAAAAAGNAMDDHKKRPATRSAAGDANQSAASKKRKRGGGDGDGDGDGGGDGGGAREQGRPATRSKQAPVRAEAMAATPRATRSRRTDDTAAATPRTRSAAAAAAATTTRSTNKRARTAPANTRSKRATKATAAKPTPKPKPAASATPAAAPAAAAVVRPTSASVVGAALAGDAAEVQQWVRFSPGCLRAPPPEPDVTGAVAGVIALWDASERGHVAVVRVLVAEGMLAEEAALKARLQAASPDDFPIHFVEAVEKAAALGHFELARFLVQAGCSPAAALIAAADGSHLALIEWLVTQRLVDVNVLHKDTTALQAAARSCRGRVQVLLWLLGNGALVEKRNTLGRTALHFAAECGSVAAIGVLVGAGGASVDPISNDGQTPLHLACEIEPAPAFLNLPDALRVVKLLVQLGADINFDDNSGSTPMRTAIRNENFATARWLQRQGAEDFGALEEDDDLYDDFW